MIGIASAVAAIAAVALLLSIERAIRPAPRPAIRPALAPEPPPWAWLLLAAAIGVAHATTVGLVSAVVATYHLGSCP